MQTKETPQLPGHMGPPPDDFLKTAYNGDLAPCILALVYRYHQRKDGKKHGVDLCF